MIRTTLQYYSREINNVYELYTFAFQHVTALIIKQAYLYLSIQ